MHNKEKNPESQAVLFSSYDFKVLWNEEILEDGFMHVYNW